MSAKNYKLMRIERWNQRCIEILQTRNNLSRDDLEYLVSKIDGMKDERLKQCITTLIGWGDDERAEMETFCAISIELMKQASPYKLRTTAENVELRYHLRKGKE